MIRLSWKWLILDNSELRRRVVMEQEKQQGNLLQFIQQGHGFNVGAERSSAYTVRGEHQAEGAIVTLFLANLECYTYQMSKI